MDHKPFRTSRQIMALRQGRNDWYRIANSAGGPVQVSIYDEIGYFGVTASDFIRDLGEIRGDVELHLNSPGGEVFDGIAIYEALSQRPGNVRVTVDSLAASIASVIAMAASPGQLEMGRHSMMMIHDGFAMGIGNAADLRELADTLDKASDTIADIYAERSGQPVSHWRDLMRSESWFTAQEAVDAGLADRVRAGRDGAPQAQWDLSIFARRPGLQAKALPVHHTATVDETWDGPAAVAAMPNDDAVLRYCHAWESERGAEKPASGDDDADDMKGSYKFPHHKTKGGPANLAACRDGLARLSSANIPDGDRDGVHAHLAAHLRDGGGEPSDHTHEDLWAGFDPQVLRAAFKGGEQ